MSEKLDLFWDDNPIDITSEANFIWSIANKLRGSYMPDKYGDVIIPMTVLRRFECVLAKTKEAVVKKFESDPNVAPRILEKTSGFQFYNVSHFDLAELCNDEDANLAEDFKSYKNNFSTNIQEILNELELDKHIDKMNKDGCLLAIIKAFSELDLSIEKFDSIKMGYIFENLIGRFYQNVDAGQYYTGRDIIKTLVSILVSEGCDDIFEENKVITVCDQACGTGGMLSTAYSYLKHYNPSCDVRLFGQEFMGQTYAIGLAEMLIKGQDAKNFRHADTFKIDCFKDQKMRFVIENPPFGTPWSGEDAKEGQEQAVKDEYAKGMDGRWGAGLPGGGDSQLIFMQSAIDKMDGKNGRAAIIENGSPLFKGDTGSGESQIRRWMLESDLIEAIIALPTDLFYNTGIATYVWILSKNKRSERKGKVQLIDASNIYHKLRKAVGNKKNELTPEDRVKITKLYTDFEENDLCKVFNNEDFLYREYSIYQPLQKSYEITEGRIEEMIQSGCLSNFYDENKVFELENSDKELSDKEKKTLDKFLKNKATYEKLLETLRNNISDKKWLDIRNFEPILDDILIEFDSKLIDKVIDGLGKMDKTAIIQKDKKGNIIYDKETKDIEIVNYTEDIDDYMAREVLPYVPDAKAFFEEKADAKKPVIKVGAEIPFTRIFYKYKEQESSDKLLQDFIKLDEEIKEKVARLVK
mgnify:CR=1 FL=1